MDAIVVGGGLGGLICANELADRGVAVRLLESHRALGGRGRLVEMDGFVVNQGPHALYLGGPAALSLRRLGVGFAGARPRRAGAVALWRGELERLPGTPMDLVRTLLLSARGKAALTRFLVGVATGRLRGAPDLSCADVLERIVRRDARAVAWALIRLATYCADLQLLSSDAGVEQLRLSLLRDVLYVDGGWQALIEGLRSRAIAAGVELHTETRVSGCVRDGDGWCIDSDRGEFVARGVVVATGTPQSAERLLGVRFGRSGIDVRATVLNLGSRGSSPSVAGLRLESTSRCTPPCTHLIQSTETNGPSSCALGTSPRTIDRARMAGARRWRAWPTGSNLER